jgi:hypothetical protein
MLGPSCQGLTIDRDLDVAAEVRSEHRDATLGQPFQRRGGRVPVRVVGPDRDEREPGLESIQERPGRRRRAAVMRNLQELDRRNASSE